MIRDGCSLSFEFVALQPLTLFGTGQSAVQRYKLLFELGGFILGAKTGVEADLASSSLLPSSTLGHSSGLPSRSRNNLGFWPSQRLSE